jgi:hypothetical protein
MQKKIALFHDRATGFKGRQRVKEHELDLYLAFAPAGYDGASTTETLPTLIKIVPRPKIVNKPLVFPKETEGGGEVVAALQKYEVSEVSRNYLDEELRPLYFLVVPADQELVEEEVRTRVNPRSRYMLVGTPQLFQSQWKFILCEER